MNLLKKDIKKINLCNAKIIYEKREKKIMISGKKHIIFIIISILFKLNQILSQIYIILGGKI